MVLENNGKRVARLFELDRHARMYGFFERDSNFHTYETSINVFMCVFSEDPSKYKLIEGVTMVINATSYNLIQCNGCKVALDWLAEQGRVKLIDYVNCL